MLWDHLEVGFLDGMFATFDCYQHPVVLIGEQALRWMAVGVVTDEVQSSFYFDPLLHFYIV